MNQTVQKPRGIDWFLIVIIAIFGYGTYINWKGTSADIFAVIVLSVALIAAIFFARLTDSKWGQVAMDIYFATGYLTYMYLKNVPRLYVVLAGVMFVFLITLRVIRRLRLRHRTRRNS